MSVSDTVWDHLKTGKRYRILDFYINEADLTPYVRYQEDGGGGIFGRACAIFFDGRFVPVERDVPQREGKAKYDPTKPLEVNWDALHEEAPSAEAIVEAMRVEDSQGTRLQIGDWVRLENEYTEDTKIWPHTNPLTPARIADFPGDGWVEIEDVTGLDDPAKFRPRALRFVKRATNGDT